MRCRICGAKLKKEGDICNNCYKLYQEEEDLKKDTNVRYKMKRKYSLNYCIVKNFWIIIIFILSMVCCIAGKSFWSAIGVLLIFLIVMGLLLFLDKRIAMGTQATFYDKKIIYTFDLLFIHQNKVVKYSNITDIVIFSQSIFQRKYDLGDICVYTKGFIPLAGGFYMKNVEAPKEVLQELAKIVKISDN